MRKIIAGLFCCLVCNVYGAVLQGYGEVEHCYKVPDKSIPTCDGSAYVGYVSGGQNYCYIPSLGCNMMVEVEGIASYDKPDEFGKLYETVTSINLSEYDKSTATYIYCRMTYPYVGYYVAQSVYGGFMPLDESFACDNLFADLESYDCYQNRADADEWCVDDFYFTAFYSDETEEIFLSSLFSSVESLCDIGITKFKTSSGLEFQLYAEKYTTPSLVVLYNGQKCYGKLGQGRAQNTINLMFDGAVYHLE